MEKPADVKELVFIEEVTESLEIPSEWTAQSLDKVEIEDRGKVPHAKDSVTSQ